MNENYLAHYGVLGMKWGVRKKRETSPKMTRKEKKTQKKELKKIEKRQKILSSPRLLSKNLDNFTKAEIDQAVTRMRLNRDLRQLDIGQIRAGSDYANAFLATGTTLVAAYGLYKSPLGQAIAAAIKKG